MVVWPPNTAIRLIPIYERISIFYRRQIHGQVRVFLVGICSPQDGHIGPSIEESVSHPSGLTATDHCELINNRNVQTVGKSMIEEVLRAARSAQHHQ